MTEYTLLLRQVHPSWVQEGRITSQVFKPTPKDTKKLSVYNGDLTEAQQSWEHYTHMQFQSIGVLAVTVGECDRHELETNPDPIPNNKAHAIINFKPYSESDIKKKAKSLTRIASERGWRYQPHE